MSHVAPTPAATSDTAALPVALDLAGRHAESVRRWVEGVLGWQSIDGDTAALVPAALRVVDLAAASGSASRTSLPTVLLVGEDEAPAVAAAVASRWQPDLTLPWPEGREDLRAGVASLLAAPRAVAGGARTVRVGGAAGGVGTSTVALGLAGLAAWSGSRTLVAVGATAPIGQVVTIPAAALSAPDLWRRGTPLPGVPQARAVRVVDGLPMPDPAAAELEVVVLDVGVASDVDVLVCRADAAGLSAASTTTAAGVVVVGEGPASGAAVRRACGERRWLALPRSARVARAGLHRRVPTALPGTWLRDLRPLAPVAYGATAPG